MKDSSTHIITNNYIRVKRKYFEEIIAPVLGDIVSKIEPIKKTYFIAGKTICLLFYSKILYEKMNKALIHNEEDKINIPDLTVCLWDSVSTNTHMVLPWKNGLSYTYIQEINTKTTNDNSFLGVYLNGEETLNLYDEKNNTAYFWINNALDLPFWIIASPLRSIFNWFFSKNNIHLIHGAVVGLNGKSVLLTAKGGSGKSTTALACLFAGMDYLGDDYITLESGDIIMSHSLFNSVKVFPQSLNKFSLLKEKVWNKDNIDTKEGKAIVFLSELFPNQIIRTASLHAILIPVIKNTQKTKIVKASKLQTMLAMIPTTLFQLSLTKSNKIAELKSIIEKTPCYFLELGYNLDEIPEVIKSFLSYESK